MDTRRHLYIYHPFKGNICIRWCHT